MYRYRIECIFLPCPPSRFISLFPDGRVVEWSTATGIAEPGRPVSRPIGETQATLNIFSLSHWQQRVHYQLRITRSSCVPSAGTANRRQEQPSAKSAPEWGRNDNRLGKKKRRAGRSNGAS